MLASISCPRLSYRRFRASPMLDFNGAQRTTLQRVIAVASEALQFRRTISTVK